VAATAALWSGFNMRGGLQRRSSSLVMGGAVCGMHYTGMAAASFIPAGAFAASSDSALKSNELGLIVFGITLFVLVLLSWGSRIIERSQTEGLRNAHQELQRQVTERTAELAKANEDLRRDNAERRAAERALERQRAFLRQVIDINPNLIFARDREGRFTLANQAVADAYGTTVENLVGKRDADFNPNPAEVESSLERDRELMDTLREKLIPE